MILTTKTDLEELDEQVKTSLAALGLHPHYRIAEENEVAGPPCAYYFFDRETLRGSDDKTEIREVYLTVILVTEKKDFALERKIEKAFDLWECDKTEDFNQNDLVFEETFVFKVIQKIRR